MVDTKTKPKPAFTTRPHLAAAVGAPVSSGMGLADLFEPALNDICHAEKKICKAMPKMIKAARNRTLKTALTNHRDETAGRSETVEKVFELFGKRAKAEKCGVSDSILEVSVGLRENFGETAASDAAIIFSARPVAHCEKIHDGSNVA